ncbi:MAG TPA: glycosyltransferase, partial [Aequorivita sp.]|nr:glycosyltransferase [Aequorivita sp.]
MKNINKTKKKLVYLTNRPSPYQVKFCYKLNKYFNAEFWFYDKVERTRPAFWNIPLGEKCKMIPKVFFKDSSRYFTFTHLNWLKKYNPDIVLLGGLSSPANYLAYRWAKRNGKKCVLFTEKSRTKEGKLRKKNFYWSVLTYLYRNIDLIMVASADAVPQFKEEFGFGDKVVQSQYPVDIDDLFSHPLRTQKESYNLIFANRLIPIYNPMGAIRIFSKLIEKHPNVHLFMNAHGELRKECESYIDSLELNANITFLDKISAWEDLSSIYKKSDIYFFPAEYSNGNLS